MASRTACGSSGSRSPGGESSLAACAWSRSSSALALRAGRRRLHQRSSSAIPSRTFDSPHLALVVRRVLRASAAHSAHRWSEGAALRPASSRATQATE